MYITFISKQAENAPTISFTDLLKNYSMYQNATFNTPEPLHNNNFFYTYTKLLQSGEYNKQNLYNKYDIIGMSNAILALTQEIVPPLLKQDMTEHYETFYIPKHSGGTRRIDAPRPQLMDALHKLKDLFENKLHILPHNAAYAYVKGRSTKDALIVHKQNESKWFLKLDIQDFFPNCNFNFIMKQLGEIFPFNILFENIIVRIAFADLIKLCLLNDKLPQGTPMSPLLTNIIMTPIDYQLEHQLRDFDRQSFKYTRYADDILISCKYDFNFQNVQKEVQNVLRDTPFLLKTEKTRYGSSSGSNWNLGLMLNKDNEITIGYKKKQRFKAMIFNFFRDLTNGNPWTMMETQALLGQVSYYKRIEPDYIKYVLDKYSAEFHTDFFSQVKRILKG